MSQPGSCVFNEMRRFVSSEIAVMQLTLQATERKGGKTSCIQILMVKKPNTSVKESACEHI